MGKFTFRSITELNDHLTNGPVTLLGGREVSLEEACRIQEVDPIVKRFGTWAVTHYGVECLTTHYAIPKARLSESDWKDHMIHKTWTVAYDVCDALDFALEYFMVGKKKPERQDSPLPGVVRRPRQQSLSNRLRYLVMRRDRSTCQLCGRTALPSPPTERKPMTTQPTDRMLQFFEYSHLPERLQEVSAPFGDLARRIVDSLPQNPERTVALRKLLEAKDCAVRALLYHE